MKTVKTLLSEAFGRRFDPRELDRNETPHEPGINTSFPYKQYTSIKKKPVHLFAKQHVGGRADISREMLDIHMAGVHGIPHLNSGAVSTMLGTGKGKQRLTMLAPWKKKHLRTLGSTSKIWSSSKPHMDDLIDLVHHNLLVSDPDSNPELETHRSEKQIGNAGMDLSDKRIKKFDGSMAFNPYFDEDMPLSHERIDNIYSGSHDPIIRHLKNRYPEGFKRSVERMADRIGREGGTRIKKAFRASGHPEADVLYGQYKKRVGTLLSYHGLENPLESKNENN